MKFANWITVSTKRYHRQTGGMIPDLLGPFLFVSVSFLSRTIVTSNSEKAASDLSVLSEFFMRISMHVHRVDVPFVNRSSIVARDRLYDRSREISLSPSLVCAFAGATKASSCRPFRRGRFLAINAKIHREERQSTWFAEPQRGFRRPAAQKYISLFWSLTRVRAS